MKRITKSLHCITFIEIYSILSYRLQTYDNKNTFLVQQLVYYGTHAVVSVASNNNEDVDRVPETTDCDL